VRWRNFSVTTGCQVLFAEVKLYLRTYRRESPPPHDFFGHLSGNMSGPTRRCLDEQPESRIWEFGERRGRWSSRRKTDVVLRLVRGEDLDSVSRELGVTATVLAQWRDEFLAAGRALGRPTFVDDRRSHMRTATSH
jgi:hypothetical protein